MFRLRFVATSNLAKRAAPPVVRTRSTIISRSIVPATSITTLSSRGLSSSSQDTKKKKPSNAGAGITVARKGKKAGYCYGCGADLVKGEAGSMGTVEKSKSYWAQKNDTLKKSKIKNWDLCPRCKRLLKAEQKGNIEAQVEALAPDNIMTDIFRQEVSKIRKVEDAVVVLCVDAVNINGTLLSTIRNYVGGNPILLAVTRCDLLPEYTWKGNEHVQESIKENIRQRAKSIMPAEVYLCSESPMREIGGIEQLARDLWENLNGRDPYIVGCANIGKSTLTDILITDLLDKGDGQFRDRLAVKRLKKLQEARSTKSALPGTTLANIRVPCFKNHEQALWDTPGLLVDDSLHQFPIRNFKVIRAQRPSQVEPDIYVEEGKKSFALLVTEKDDDVPLLRIEIRLKKNAEGNGPIRVVWNSTLPLSTKICDIDEARQVEQTRWKEMKEQEEERQEHIKEVSSQELTPEEKEARKEKRRKEYLERIKAEKEEMGGAEWHRREKERKAKEVDNRRIKALAMLAEIHEVIVERNVGMDLAIANFGWLGVLMPRTAMIKTFAPKTGVKVTNYDALALPPSWGPFKTQSEGGDTDGKESDAQGETDLYEFDPDEELEYEDEEFMYDEEVDEEFMYDEEVGARYGRYNNKFQISYNREDIWADFQGEKVGWQYDSDTRFMAELPDGSRREEGWNPIREEGI